MDDQCPIEGARRVMVLALANGWQIAVGLPLVKTQRALSTHLADAMSVPAEPRTLLERPLLRGYYLEVACALRAAIRRCRDAEGRRRLHRVIEGLRQPEVDAKDLEVRVRDAVEWLRDPALRSQPDLDQRVRAALDAWTGRFSVRALARRVGSNVTYVTRCAKRELGVSPTTYVRQRRKHAVMQALRAQAASRKEIAATIGCAEATVQRLVRAALNPNGCRLRLSDASLAVSVTGRAAERSRRPAVGLHHRS